MIDQARLWRVVRGAPRKAKAITHEGERIERREQAVMQFGAELSRLRLEQRIVRDRATSAATGSARAPST